jgi:hypothetical protein
MLRGMKVASMLLRLVLAWCLALPSSCATTAEGVAEEHVPSGVSFP